MTSYSTHLLTPESSTIPNVLELVQRAFAYMEPRINPPSSMNSLTVESIRDECLEGEVWTIGDRPDACVFLKKRGDFLYVGKLSVHEKMRGKGLARSLIETSVQRAKSLGLAGLELETRIELIENHQTFERLGFVKSGEGAHEGYSRSTFVIMRRSLAGEA